MGPRYPAGERGPDWATTVAPTRYAYFTSPVVADGVLYIAHGAPNSDARIHALNARNGDLLDTIRPNAEWVGSLAVADSTLFARAGGRNYQIIAYRA